MTALHSQCVAVTGADGFIGSAIVRRLRQVNAEVRALYGPPQTLPAPTLPRFAVCADICDREAVARLVEGVAVVVHLAGPPSVSESWIYPDEFMRVHSAGTACLLNACAGARVRRFVYVSSAEVYGQPADEFVREDQPLAPRSPYAVAKLAAEKLVEIYGRARQLETIILRPFSIYGPGASPFSVLSRMIASLRGGGPLRLRDLRPVRDYTFIEDFADAVVAACAALRGGSVVNIGTMQGISVGQLAQSVVRQNHVPIAIEEEGGDPRHSEILRLVADNSRARYELGWSPSRSLAEGLRLTLNV